ncbi:hypothetical protein TNCV_3068101 [Trichonephila clavipes]|nr:hypothetical protein TNCV_3068101 [Trichonephila clavipes]
MIAQCNAGSSTNVPEHSVWLTLSDMGLRRRHINCVPLLTKFHHRLRIKVSVFPNENGSFQHDYALCHKTRMVLERFEEHNGNI